jgi:hypothetical protein
MKTRLMSLVLLLPVVLSLLFLPRAANASSVCHVYNDGCTICDFYGPKGEYQGYIEWCH